MDEPRQIKTKQIQTYLRFIEYLMQIPLLLSQASFPYLFLCVREMLLAYTNRKKRERESSCQGVSTSRVNSNFYLVLRVLERGREMHIKVNAKSIGIAVLSTSGLHF